ncbi:AbrB/MazE/SpoVT family DNA-binding domain-containing protein [Sphingomonas sp. ABOLD]|uniref:Antitoxin VapB n=1 Tax=Sphingomonas trueperi TaxID=53317 RepID=A0A7X5XXQ6_9SPHN|nr:MULTISPECIES: AbrB/MazE/SpoVT family DNA-binding domain-containing protein [Sphingomonas]NJB97017.1 antitoxin VapB [Sphingomonas trueperi]RSV42821.1 AbrB/MazE/SpoVT family DNA-binding domain-containing protein [Sphingomonas sp. ABOLE]RSV50807.1 AbrB/MazE/SpoVT family DNA-binding domain-containing protein [Sphingomonas sp. ABOLD]
MGEEYRARIFKSGNSLALRLPKALGLKEGAEVVLREERRGFSVEPLDGEEKIDLGGIAGALPWLKPIPPEDREIEERELDWEGRRLRDDG